MLTEQMMRLGSASCVLSKVKWAAFQTGELDRKKTIISVDNDESIVLEWAVQEYIDSRRKMLKERGEL